MTTRLYTCRITQPFTSTHGFIDITGKRFGRLVALQPVARENNRTHRCILWLCQCDCGDKIVTRGTRLRAGVTRSCGCLNGPNRTIRVQRLAERYRYQIADFDRAVHEWLSRINARAQKPCQ